MVKGQEGGRQTGWKKGLREERGKETERQINRKRGEGNGKRGREEGAQGRGK
jgi:hypothetical protein